MNFQEAEKAYQALRAQYSAGKLNNTEFEAEVSKLKVQDAEGRWWQIGVQSGDWYAHDGQKWTKAKPPVAGTPPVQPSAPPEGVPLAAAASTPPTPASKPSRTGGLTPRLFSAAPAGRGGGLPTPILIGIIAVVALVGIGIIVAAYLLLSGQSKGLIASATTTPTKAPVVVLPTTVLPTLPPPPPTNTQVILPTIAVTRTAVVTTTVPATTAPTTGTVRATATRRPVTPTVAAVPAATKGPALPPGVYVSKLQTDPAVINFNDAVGFRVTLLNTTGAGKTYKWIIKIFQCSQNPCIADDFRRSIGESTVVESNLQVGTTEVIAPKHWSAGVGACTYVAMPHYFDPVSQQVIPFLQADGQPMYYLFSMCH